MSYPPGTPDDGEPTPQDPYPGTEGQPESPGQQPGYGQPGYGDPAYGQPGYGDPYSPAGYEHGYPTGPAQPTNGKATAALITGIASLVLSWCCGLGVVGVVAIVLGVKARSEIRAGGGRQTGDGMALAGIITGAVAVVLGVLVLLFVVLAIANGDFSTYDYDY